MDTGVFDLSAIAAWLAGLIEVLLAALLAWIAGFFA